MSGCDLVRSEVSKYSDWDIDTMVAISRAESSCRLDAKGDTNITYSHNGRIYGYSLGVFQIRILPGREYCDTYDLATNVKCAHNVWKSQGLKAWSVYKSGKYKRFL